MITLLSFRAIQPYLIEFYKVDELKNSVLVDCVNAEDLDISKPDDLAKYDAVWVKYRDQRFAGFIVRHNARGLIHQFYYYAPADK